MKNVILSTTMLLEEGDFSMKAISLEEARKFAETAENFVGHSTVKILNIEPSTDRKTCENYDNAIIIKPKKRLEFGKEYTKEEIIEIGIEIFKIEKK